MHGSLDLHNIVEFPCNFDSLIHDGDARTFNFFESMYPLNIRKDAENGLYSAFQFWNLPKIKKLFDELLDEFIFEYKDSDNNPERTYDTTKFGVVAMTAQKVFIIKMTLLIALYQVLHL